MPTQKNYNRILLVYLLQLLSPLFGVTAIIGVIINHTQNGHIEDPVSRSHSQWQIMTFWVGFALLSSAFLLPSLPLLPTLFVVFTWVYYRVIKGYFYLRRELSPR